MHINSVHTRTEHTRAHKHPSFPPTHTHLCVNELFLWRGQVERSQSFQPKKSIASSWIIEMFAISFFTKKRSHCSMFPPPAYSLLLPCDIMTHRHKFSHIKVFILLMTRVSQYFNIFSPVLAVFVHMHIFLTQQLSSSTQHLMEGTLQVKKKKKKHSKNTNISSAAKCGIDALMLRNWIKALMLNGKTPLNECFCLSCK